MTGGGYIEIKTAVSDKEWDAALLDNPDGGDVMQCAILSSLKEQDGWHVERWRYHLGDGTEIAASVLARKFVGVGEMAYIRRGPGVNTIRQLNDIVHLHQKHMSKRFFMITMEPLLSRDIPLPHELSLRSPIQPNAHTIWIDLKQSEDDLLASFRQRARREIRKAEKDGLRVEKQALDHTTMKWLHNIYGTTAKRGGFIIRPFSYHSTYWSEMSKAGLGELYVAKTAEGIPVAAAFICLFGKKALYKDGVSVRGANKHFAHLLQWTIMKDLKARGVEAYDMHGVPPSDKIDNSKHPLAGLATFKLSFSQEVTDYIGAVDQIFDRKKYKVWKGIGGQIHRKINTKIKQRPIY